MSVSRRTATSGATQGRGTDPAALLDRAWAMEPAGLLRERSAALDRLQELLESGAAPAAPAGRDWAMELLAERAIDDAAQVRLLDAQDRANRVLREADPAAAIARARATLALGRALCWIGTAEASRRGDRALRDAIDLFAQLGHDEWRGFTMFWRAQTVFFENGRLPEAARLMDEALEILPPGSGRRAVILDFYADVLVNLGELDRADATLDVAAALADEVDEGQARSFVAWSRAHVTAARGDAHATERALREVERDATDWFETQMGTAFLTDAADLLDRVGLTEEADTFLRRARERVDDDVFEESIEQTVAAMQARTGDPAAALRTLQSLTRGDWLEKRLVWRYTLLTAWATYRASGPQTRSPEAGMLAARALDQAVACGSTAVATAGEPDLTPPLAALAERTGSVPARELLAAGRPLLVRAFGTCRVVDTRTGAELPLPAGKPGELVRMLAVHPYGLPVDAVNEQFFPDAPPAAGRQRLRQILTRLRAAAGEIVVRDGEMLRLLPAWVDAVQFLAAADRVRGAHGPRAEMLAYAALAVCDGPLLPGDPYAAWADDTRARVEDARDRLLEIVAGDALRWES